MSEQDVFVFHRAESPLRQRPDGRTDPAGETGWYLERERRRRGLSHHEICDVTGIHPHHLASLETGDLTGLPSRTETMHLLSVYARHLGFDPEPLLRHYAGILPEPALINRSRNAKAPKPFSSAKIIPFWAAFKLPPISRTGGAIASSLAAILLFSALALVWSPATPGDETRPTDRDLLPTATTEAAPAPQITVSERATPQPGAEGDMSAFITRQLTAAADPKARVVLTAHGSVWLRIVDRDGGVIMSSILNAGEHYAVPDIAGVSVIARDGGLISYAIDGKDRGTLGRPGEIIVGKPLSVAALMDSQG